MTRGRPLEVAILRAARKYRKDGRAMLVKQATPMATGADGLIVYSGTAPVDFLGCHRDGRALAIEAKSTKRPSWPIADLRDDQREALSAFDGLGADVQLMLSFDELGETYALPWRPVATFLANPWRESFTPAWCRAFGLLVPEQDRGDESRRRCLFLDAAEHVDAAQARLAMVEEQQRAKPVAKVEEPEPARLAAPSRPSFVSLSEEERRARILDACNEGIGRALKSAAQAQRFAPRRGRR